MALLWNALALPCWHSSKAIFSLCEPSAIEKVSEPELLLLLYIKTFPSSVLLLLTRGSTEEKKNRATIFCFAPTANPDLSHGSVYICSYTNRCIQIDLIPLPTFQSILNSLNYTIFYLYSNKRQHSLEASSFCKNVKVLRFEFVFKNVERVRKACCSAYSSKIVGVWGRAFEWHRVWHCALQKVG